MAERLVVLGIDPGTACGWAIAAQGGPYACGCWSLHPRRHESPGMRYLRLERYLREAIVVHRPRLIAYEDVRRHLGADAAHIYGGITGTVQRVCAEHDLPFTAIAVATIKRCATRSGRADKGTMVAHAKARWPELDIVDDNAADALWIAECALAELEVCDAAKQEGHDAEHR